MRSYIAALFNCLQSMFHLLPYGDLSTLKERHFYLVLLKKPKILIFLEITWLALHGVMSVPL